ncbi:MAG: Na(+)/H(+) antiporter subunit D [Parvibaculum sp.]|jgi:multicomponent Na+:H+ antiporter subunit D|nr:Na(+)/H(+) antiporter subunit D [Parvibaculum sp.]
MIDLFPPFLLFVAGAALLPFIPNGHPRALAAASVPVISVYLIWMMPEGMHGQFTLVGQELTLLRVDKLSTIFGLIFSLAAFLGLIFAWYVRDTIQQTMSLLYAGTAIGAVFAGDLISLFIFWEGTAIASVFLIWARRTEGAYWTGMRYLIVQVGSGVILLAGMVLQYNETGSMAFEAMTLGSPATWAIFIAFGVKCAFPLLHNWMPDAYPAATVTGTVILSVFTTKLAIYALARGFAGTEILIYIGATMAIFPVFYAVIENDLRRVLTYSLNQQLGFMVVGIGVGTELALNGTIAHAFASILYQALLFMSIGAVLFRTGTAKASELGGLYKTMPLTMVFCVIGAASISSFPLFSGFVSKSLILSASMQEGYYIVWGILLFASAGAFIHSGIKVPFFAFFAQDSGLRPKEAPWNMLLAMGLTASLCIAIGVYPYPLYALLPYDVDYVPYTTTHVVTQLQLLFFYMLAFVVLMKTGIYPPELKSVNLDFDWTYRKLGPAIIRSVRSLIQAVWGALIGASLRGLNFGVATLERAHGTEGPLARAWPTGSMVLWIAVLLGGVLLLNYM